jgi:hypothetical protein
VGGGGQVGRGRRGGQRAALSTASGPVRAQLELSTCPPRGVALRFRGRCAKSDMPMSTQLAG